MNEKNKRTIEVTVLGIFTLTISILGLAILFLLPQISLPQPPLSFSEQYIREIPFFIFFVLLFTGGIGIISLKKWGRILVIILSTIWLARILFYLYRFIKGTFCSEPLIFVIIYVFVFPIIFAILAIVFLTRSKVKKQFR